MGDRDRRKNPFTELFAVRVDPECLELVDQMAKQDHLSDAMFIEQLVFDEAEERGLLPASDAWAKLMALQTLVGTYLGERKDEPGPDITLDCFEYLRTSAAGARAHSAAVKPPAGISAEKRRQYVHQRIGRFIKQYLRRESAGEVLLPPSSPALIRSYTRLVKKGEA